MLNAFVKELAIVLACTELKIKPKVTAVSIEKNTPNFLLPKACSI